MILSRSIALVGLPGSGKSTLGRLLAKRLSVEFVDSDVVLEKSLGISISEYFTLHGEQAFRDQETRILSSLCVSPKRQVISTGGGVVLRDANRAILSRSTTVIYLRSSTAELHQRLKHDTSRPLLQVADPLAKLEELYSLRDPLYREVATFTIDTMRVGTAALVNKIVMQLELASQC